MTIRISLGMVLAALVLVAIGAGSAVGVMLWEPWDGDDDAQRRVTDVSPASDVPRLAPDDVFNLFTAACLDGPALEVVSSQLRARLNIPIPGLAIPGGPPGDDLDLKSYPEYQFVLREIFVYEGDGWWRIQPGIGLWRIHEVTAEVRPSC